MEEETGSTCPPRSYACMFCKKGFTSAQALGGHMNVHRRDRALLRQCRAPNHANSQHNVPPGEQVMTGHRPGSAEDQMASVYKVPISGDLQSNLAPFSRPCSSSWPSVVIRGTLTTRFSVSNDDHGACAARDLENQVTLEGTEDDLDLELRLGEKP